MIILIVLSVWAIGWIFSIYPIYANLVKTHQEHMYIKSRHDPLQRSDLAKSMAAASGIGMVWFFALPVLISIAIHKRRIPDLSRDTDNFIEEYKQTVDLKEAIAKRRKELEQESASNSRDYDDHWPNRRRT